MEQICRGCLKNNSNINDMYSLFSTKELGINLYDVFSVITDLPCSLNDDYPDKICSECMILLNSAYEFRKKCIKSYEYIKNLQTKTTNEKMLTTATPTTTSTMSDSNITNDSVNVDNDIDLLFNDIIEIVDQDQLISINEERNNLQLDNDNSNSSNIATNEKCVAESNYKEKSAIDVDSLQGNILSTNNNQEIYKCDVCHRICRSNQGLSQHLRMHDIPLNIISFLCGTCNESFTNLNSLKNHEIDAHPTNTDNDDNNNNLMLQCYMCPKIFPDVESFTLHLTQIHKNIDLESTFSCHLCKRKFTHQRLLNNHLKCIHDNESTPLNNQCRICEKKFRSIQAVNLHVRAIHNREKRYKCDTCDKKYFYTSELKNHKLRVHTKERKYICKCCSNKFYTSNQLNVHLRKHVDNNSYKCTYDNCKRIFTQSSELIFHVKSNHTGERAFQCSLCDKSYFTKQHLRQHIETNHFEGLRERKFLCKICETGFYRKSTLTKHIRFVHKKNSNNDNDKLLLSNDNSDASTSKNAENLI